MTAGAGPRAVGKADLPTLPGSVRVELYALTAGDGEMPRRMAAGGQEGTRSPAPAILIRLADCARSSTIPVGWSIDRSGHAEIGRALPPRLYDMQGLMFPLGDGRGIGFGVMMGQALSPDEDALVDLHLEWQDLFARHYATPPAPQPKGPRLTRRERECLQLTAEGNTGEEIARRLGLSAHTTAQYLAEAQQKLGTVNRMQAVTRALRLKLIA